MVTGSPATVAWLQVILRIALANDGWCFCSNHVARAELFLLTDTSKGVSMAAARCGLALGSLARGRLAWLVPWSLQEDFTLRAVCGEHSLDSVHTHAWKILQSCRCEHIEAIQVEYGFAGNSVRIPNKQST
eukprot:s374_g50.t1